MIRSGLLIAAIVLCVTAAIIPNERLTAVGLACVAGAMLT